MKQPLLHNVLAVAVASCMAIGLHRHEMAQEERIQKLEDALLLEKKNRGTERPSRRGLQDDCECPFAKNADGDWVTTDADSLFIFEKGIIIGKKNAPACNYGNNILSVDADGSNCPSGDGSVTFGTGNTASGEQSAVVGGRFNGASGDYSSVSGGISNVAYGPYSSINGGGNNAVNGDSYAGSILGGFENTVNGDYGSVSGGFANDVQGGYGSILGGQDHVLEAAVGTIPSNCECPFTKNEDDDWVTTDTKSLFIFKKGIIIGKKNVGQYTPACNYGNNILSVDVDGDNCPSGDGSVTFGWGNTASGKWSCIVAGGNNVASGHVSSISGGESHVAAEYAGSISGGKLNKVNGMYGSILGGQGHVLEANAGTVSSKSNFKNATNATVIETIPAHHPEDRIVALEEHSPFNCTAEEGWCTSEHKRFLFSEGVVVGVKNPECKYGTGTLSVDFKGTNCPAHRGSVTFGKNNQMSRAGSFTVG